MAVYSRRTLALVGIVLSGLAGVSGCARTAEERQLDDMRSEIDRIQESRDRADQAEMGPQAADSQVPRIASPPSQSPPLSRQPHQPADEDSVTVGTATPDPIEGYADTEDTTPRPSIRILGSGRATTRGWHPDEVEQTQPEGDTSAHSSFSRPQLDPAAASAYDGAMSLVASKQYEKALDAFAAFLVRWPDHPYADNAMYWRGECYFARGDYRRASEQFEGVLARFPAGNKAPDALLKLGLAFQRLGDPVKAKETFDRLAQLYPQSEAARRIPPVTVPATTPRGPAPEDHR
jgi:tol-pal system protein YbgF